MTDGRQFWEEEAAVGVVEIIFKNQLTALVKSIFIRIGGKAEEIY